MGKKRSKKPSSANNNNNASNTNSNSMYSGGGGQSEFHNDSQAQLQRMMQLDAQQQQQNSSQNNTSNSQSTSTGGSGMFTPQMIRELLASAGATGITSSPMSAYEAGRKAGEAASSSSGSGGNNGGGDSVTIQGMGSIQLSEGQRQAIKSMLMNDGGGNSSTSYSASAGGNTGNNNSNGQNVADQTEAAQRYLQSISQALLSGSLSGSSGQVNAVPFGPPPPPNKKPTSVTVNVAGGQSTTFDIDGSDLSPESAAGVQSLGLQLEALSALMSQATSSTPQRQQQQQSSPGRNRNRNNSRSGNRGSSQPFNMAEMAAGTGATPAQAQQLYDMLSNSATTDAEKLESLMKLKHNPNSPAARDSDANRAANFQQLLSMVSSSASSSLPASSMTQDDDQIPDMSNLSDGLKTQEQAFQNMDLKAQEQALMALCSAGMNLGIKKGIKDSMRDAKNNRKKGGGGNNNQQPKLDSEDISGLLPIFTQLVELTNSIVSSQDEDQTDELCKKALGMNAAMNGGKVFLPPGSINMAKDVFESNIEGANRGTKMSQAEAMEKVAALTASMAQQQPQQGGGSGKRSSSNSNSATSASMPLFQMMFGGPNNNQGNNNSMNNNNVPPIPPPSGGWPQGSGPAAAAAAAMAAFATSMTDGSSNNTQAGGQQPPNYVDPNMPFPNMPQSSNNAEADSAAWLDYYDACLRARGVKGGIAEFEAFAQLSSQGAAVTAQMQSMGLRPGGGGMMKDDESDSLPAGFEYDAKQQAKSNELSQQEILALEVEAAEKSAKKAAKKREKKARQKERAKKEAEAKAAEAAKKKREKAIVSWRSRVVAACSGNGDAKKMEALVGSESPYKNYIYDPSTENPTTQEEDDNENANNEEPMTHEEYLADQLDWFLQACLQKYSNSPSSIQKQPFANNLAREKLLKYIVSQSMDVILYQSADNNFRNAIHEAAYNNDANFIKWIIESQSSDDTKPDDNSSYIDLLEGMCEDGGWTPLHYAVAGGASNVVELLMAKGVSVSSRTDRNKTCFNTGIRRRGNGVTPRELAIVLQSGAVDDDLKSDAAILDDCVENRIEEVSSTDKATYMRILKSLEERLASVEKNGYTPPPKKGGMLTIGTGNKSSATEVQDQQRTTEATLLSSSGSKKSKKKKKKKEVPVQQTNAKAAAAQAPVAILKPPASKPTPPLAAEEVEEDLSDPVAVALLGMGFTEDQIKSAARALGGFERATADDMVMWILGGGEIVSSTPRQGNAVVVEQDKPSSNPIVAASTTTPSGDSAVLTKAQKKAAAKAKRETEDAARKLQEEQAAAERAAAKKEEQRRIRRQWNEREQARHEQEKNAKIAEQMERRRRADMEKKLMMPPGVGGPPMSVQIPGGGGRPGGPGGMTINLGGPKMPPPPTKAKGSNMGIPQAPTVRGAPKILARPSAAGIPPKPSMGGGVGVGSQSLFAAGGARKPGSPPRSINTNAKPFKPAGHQPVAILSKSGNVGGQRSAAPRHPHAPQAAEYHPSTGYTGGSQMSTSSAGSASSSYVEANPTGNIRATAREFVPTFLPKPTANEFVPSTKPAIVSSMSAQPTTGAPAPVSPLPPTQTTSNDNNSADELVVPMASLLSSFGVDTNVLPSTVGNKGDSNIPSAASSITGLSGLQPTGEDNLTSRVGSALTFESNLGVGTAGGLQTSSILESIQYGGDQNAGSSTLGSGIGLWGGGATTSNTNNQTTSLAGLNFSSFMGSGDATNTNNSNGNNNAAPGGGNTWGANTGGSIW